VKNTAMTQFIVGEKHQQWRSEKTNNCKEKTPTIALWFILSFWKFQISFGINFS